MVAQRVKHEPLGQGRSFGRRQINQSQIVAGLVMGAGLFELGPALGVDQGGCDIRERVRISFCTRREYTDLYYG